MLCPPPFPLLASRSNFLLACSCHSIVLIVHRTYSYSTKKLLLSFLFAFVLPCRHALLLVRRRPCVHGIVASTPTRALQPRGDLAFPGESKQPPRDMIGQSVMYAQSIHHSSCVKKRSQARLLSLNAFGPRWRTLLNQTSRILWLLPRDGTTTCSIR